MSGIAASQAQKEMFRAFQSELNRQGIYRGQALTSLEGYLPTLGAETAQQQMGEGAGRREAAYGTLGSMPTGPYGAGATGAADKAYYESTGHNRAKLGSYSDWQNQQGISRQREGQDLGKIINYAHGDAGIFPYFMYKAQHSQDELAFWGQLISSIGGSAPQYQQLFAGPQSQQSSFGNNLYQSGDPNFGYYIGPQ